mgnify:CR=1 FL=1
MNRTSTALPSASYRANVRKVTLLALLVLLAAVCYMVVAVNFGSQQLMLYSMKIRTPKLVVMLITAFAIGGASIVFQSIINNTIVTPCLLGTELPLHPDSHGVAFSPARAAFWPAARTCPSRRM